MRKALPLLAAAIFSLPSSLPAQNEKLTPATLPEFISRYEQNLRPVDQAYDELENENLPLRDETGQRVGRRHILDRRQKLDDLMKTVRQLGANNQDLVLTTRLLIQTEALADDLFDLAQMAYDNDREEWGKRLSDLESVIDRNTDLIEAYTLDLAAVKEKRIQELEKENRELQEKLKNRSASKKTKPAPAKRTPE